MSEEKLRAAVIGGGLGGSHGYAYARAPEYELVAICDLNPEVFPRFFERAELPPGSIAQYTDYHEMLEKEQLDVVSVATPDHLHTDPVCDASNAGVRGVICEKPLTTTVKDADRIIETIEANGTKLSVDHSRSWVPSFQAVKKAVLDGEIGGLTRIVAHMGGRRSMLFRNGTHLIDGVCFFANAAPVWVIAAHEQGFEEYGPVYDGKGGKDPQYDPGSTIIIEFANGVRGIVNSAKLTPQLFEYDLQGPNGRYWLTDKHCTAWKTEEREGTPVQVTPPEGGSYTSSLGDILIPAVQEMAQMVLHDGPSSSPAYRGRDTLEIMLAALISQTKGSAKIELPLPRE